MQFAKIQGMLMRHKIPHSDPVWDTFKALQEGVGNMTSAQIQLVETLVEQIVTARNGINKQKIIAAIKSVEL